MMNQPFVSNAIKEYYCDICENSRQDTKILSDKDAMCPIYFHGFGLKLVHSWTH